MTGINNILTPTGLVQTSIRVNNLSQFTGVSLAGLSSKEVVTASPACLIIQGIAINPFVHASSISWYTRPMNSVGYQDWRKRQKRRLRQDTFIYAGESFVCHKCKCRLNPGDKARLLPKMKKIVHPTCTFAGGSRYHHPVTVTRIDT